MEIRSDRTLALVLSGGVGLGAYHAGVYEALHGQPSLAVDWLAGSSTGAVTAAVIAGSPADTRMDRLRQLWMDGQFWSEHSADRAPGQFRMSRHLQNWASALQTRVIGRAGHFHPRYLTRPFAPFASLYDLSPLRARLERLVDFERLNSGKMRVCVAATDIVSGEAVLFDTAQGTRITMDHLLASCGYLPEFAPVEIDGRLLGDGGLSMNAPIEAVLLRPSHTAGEHVCFVADLFARDGERPTGLETALARKNDLMFGNQTFLRLEGCRRESEWKDRFAAAGMGTRDTVSAVFYLSYRPSRDEAGPERAFDLSLASAGDRWRAGALDAQEAIRRLSHTVRPDCGWGLHVIRR